VKVDLQKYILQYGFDGKAKYVKQDDRSWKKEEPEPLKIALKN
jgi:hypothetical protein